MGAGVEVRAFADTMSAAERTDISLGGRLGRTAAALAEHRESVLAQARAEGYQAGFEEGIRAGEAQMRAEREAQEAEALQEFVHQLMLVRNQLHDTFDRWLEARDPELTELSTTIARAIVHEELQINPDRIRALVAAALAEVTHARSARIRINPFHAPALREHKEAVMAVSESLTSIEIVDDPSMVGCVIETEGGVVDATIDSQIQVASTLIQEAA